MLLREPARRAQGISERRRGIVSARCAANDHDDDAHSDMQQKHEARKARVAVARKLGDPAVDHVAG